MRKNKLHTAGCCGLMIALSACQLGDTEERTAAQPWEGKWKVDRVVPDAAPGSDDAVLIGMAMLAGDSAQHIFENGEYRVLDGLGNARGRWRIQARGDTLLIDGHPCVANPLGKDSFALKAQDVTVFYHRMSGPGE